MQITHGNDCEYRLGHDCTCGASHQQRDLAAAQAEIARLTQRAEKAEAERDEARSMLSNAERDMRQRAADLCDCACMDGIGDKIRAIGDEILALPLKHADREGSAARAALAGKGEA